MGKRWPNLITKLPLIARKILRDADARMPRKISRARLATPELLVTANYHHWIKPDVIEINQLKRSSREL